MNESLQQNGIKYKLKSFRAIDLNYQTKSREQPSSLCNQKIVSILIILIKINELLKI